MAYSSAVYIEIEFGSRLVMMDGRTPDRYITLIAKRGQRK